MVSELRTPAVPKPQGPVPAVRDEYKLIGRPAAGLPSLHAQPTLRGRDQLDLYLVLVVVHMSFCALKRFFALRMLPSGVRCWPSGDL